MKFLTSYSSPLRILCLSLMGVCAMGQSHAADGVYALNWQEAGPSYPEDRWVGTVYVSPAQAAVKLLTDSTEPVSPFPSWATLIKNSSADGRVRISGRPFMEPQKKGWMSFEVAMVRGGLYLTLGQNPKPYQTRNDQALIMGSENGQITLRLTADKEILVSKYTLASANVSALQSGVPYTIKISWDFTSAEPTYTIFINGEGTVNSDSGKPFVLKVSAEEAANGVDSFSMGTPRDTDSEYIVGNVMVSE